MPEAASERSNSSRPGQRVVDQAPEPAALGLDQTKAMPQLGEPGPRSAASTSIWIGRVGHQRRRAVALLGRHAEQVQRQAALGVGPVAVGLQRIFEADPAVDLQLDALLRGLDPAGHRGPGCGPSRAKQLLGRQAAVVVPGRAGRGGASGLGR